VTGRLTEEWREENGVGKLQNWRKTTLGELVLESANGFSKRKGEVGIDTVVLRKQISRMQSGLTAMRERLNYLIENYKDNVLKMKIYSLFVLMVVVILRDDL